LVEIRSVISEIRHQASKKRKK